MADQVQQPNDSRGYASARTGSRNLDDRHRRRKEQRSRSYRKGSEHDRKLRKRHHHRRHRDDGSSSASDSSSHHRKRSRTRRRENERSGNDDNDVDRRSHKRRRRDIADSSADHSTGLKPRWQRQQETSRQNSNWEISKQGDSSYQVPQRRATGVPMFLPRQQGERPHLNLAVKRSRGGVIVAQAMKAKGPDGTIGFVPGWTTRKSRSTEA